MNLRDVSLDISHQTKEYVPGYISLLSRHSDTTLWLPFTLPVKFTSAETYPDMPPRLMSLFGFPFRKSEALLEESISTTSHFTSPLFSFHISWTYRHSGLWSFSLRFHLHVVSVPVRYLQLRIATCYLSFANTKHPS